MKAEVRQGHGRMLVPPRWVPKLMRKKQCLEHFRA